MTTGRINQVYTNVAGKCPKQCKRQPPRTTRHNFSDQSRRDKAAPTHEDKPAPARPERHSVGAPALDRAALQRGRAPTARRSDEGTKRRRRDDAPAPAPAPAPSMSISESWDPSQEEEEAPAAPPPTPAEAPAPAPAPSMREPGGFAYQSVVRKKCERAKMPGHFCDQCQGFIDATKDQLSDADVKKLQDECSRHKAYHPPPGTPEGFWELSFMDSQEKRKQDSLDAF